MNNSVSTKSYRMIEKTIDQAPVALEIGKAIQAWVKAEAGGDLPLLSALLDDAYMAIGPEGYVIDKAQWLARFAKGLVISWFSVEDLNVNAAGLIAISAGLQIRSAAYQGYKADERCRITLVHVRRDQRWQLLAVNLVPYPAV